MTKTDIFDFLLVVFWSYGNGYLAAWLVEPIRPMAWRVAAVFGFLGVVLGAWGIEQRDRQGTFPIVISFPIFAIPFFCSFVGLAFWIVNAVQRWLGII